MTYVVVFIGGAFVAVIIMCLMAISGRDRREGE